MEGPLASSSPRPRPRRAPAVLLVVAAAVLVLIGRGLGILGGSADSGDDDALRSPSRPRFVEGDRTAVAPPAAPSPAPAPTPALPARPEVESAKAPNVVPDGVPAAVPATLPSSLPGERPATPPRPTPVPGSGIEADRFASIRSLIATRMDGGRIGEAIAAIERARTLPLSAAQNGDLAELRTTAESAADRRVADIVAALRDGHVGTAFSAAHDLLTDATASLHRRLLTGLQLPASDDAGRCPVADERPWPLPTALAKDRVVHTVIGGRTVAGRVVDSRSDEVTLRVQDGETVTFPTVRVVACEPTNVTAAEAVELAFAALHAKDALRARLWLACAFARGGDPNDARASRLAELLK